MMIDDDDDDDDDDFSSLARELMGIYFSILLNIQYERAKM